MAFVHKCALTACADPGVFVKGVQARQPENSLDDVFFFVLKLFSQFRLKSTFIQQLTFQGRITSVEFSTSIWNNMFSIFVPKCTGGIQCVLLQRKLYFSDPEEVQHFPVGGGGGGGYLF